MANFSLDDLRVRQAFFLSNDELAYEGATPEQIAAIRKLQQDTPPQMSENDKRATAADLVAQGAKLPSYLEGYAPELRAEQYTVESLFAPQAAPKAAQPKKEGA